MALVALAVKLDSPGPVLFRQKRFGFNNERIDVFKFRSLYHDQADPLASKVVTKNDSRVTRVGRFIRKTSLDELPQLFNVVFKSNLSLVGPRPHAVQGKLQSQLFDEAVDGYFARHRVKPGITGWAQINGWRGEVDSEEKIQKRVEFDLYYIENWSVLFDLFILLKTPLALMTEERERLLTPLRDGSAWRSLRVALRKLRVCDGVCGDSRRLPLIGDGRARRAGAAARAGVAGRRLRRHRLHRAEPLRTGDARRRRHLLCHRACGCGWFSCRCCCCCS